ncbi:MAG: leucine-rich repeat protein [Staphylococcus sp.]|nr:leucine-rich repeat protein [Staphylococcus sp.]
MKTSYKYLLSIFGAGLLMASCTDDRMGAPGGPDSELLPITLSAAYPTASRASDAGFEDGDNMGVYVLDYTGNQPQEITDGDAHASNMRFRFNGTDNTWVGAANIYWTSKDTPADIIGYYPYNSSISDPTAWPHAIARRQDQTGSETEPGGYEASDFLWAKADKAMPTTSRVDLTFSHLMAGVRVTLRPAEGFADGEWEKLEKTVLVSNIIPNSTINLKDGSVEVGTEGPISVTPYEYNGDWRAVVVPQTIKAGANVISISVDGVCYNLTKSDAMTYNSGKLHTFTIDVKRRQSTGEYEFSLADEAITAWVDDVDFRDGIVRTYINVNVDKRGTLKQIVDDKGISPVTITGLKITGEINAEDFTFMREECTALKSLNLLEATVWDGERENVIPEKAMYEKQTLTHLVFPKNTRIIGSSAFTRTALMGSLILPDGIEKIGETEYTPDNSGLVGSRYLLGAFANCATLVGELSLPSTLEFIEDGAFAQTQFTGTLNLPASVKTIGNYAFEMNKFTGDLVIPEGVENIGGGAFARNPFTGNLVLPQNTKVIYANTFAECGFTGILSLPEGLHTIENEAFDGCNFRGELMLPSTLKKISNRAFSNTKISSIIFPEDLIYLGDGAFMNCKYLQGSIEIPKKVQRVNEYLFSGCPLLSEVILPEETIYVGGGAFYGCSALNRLVCNSPEPPLVSYIDEDRYSAFEWTATHVGPFDGIVKTNFTLEVPKESVDLYRRATGWREFSRISEASNFVCRPATACALNSQHSETLVINSDGEWEVIEKPDWCQLTATEGNNKKEISLTITSLSKGSGKREGKIVFGLKGTDITTSCAVSQYDCEYDEDQCVTLQKATVGRGIDVLFIGDGWDAESIADGSYMNLVTEQMEAFFGLEPYATYRNRFNVYACITLSQETGVNTTATWRNTRFSTFYAHDCDGNGSLQLDNVDDVFDYAVEKSPLTMDRMPQSLVIMTLNNDEYGSATTITENGSAIAICSPSEGTYPMDTRGIIQHEACGHAFGKLAEERITKNRYISDQEKTVITGYHWKGWYQNISISGKMTDVAWNHFIFDPRYSNAVDIFEGAYGKTRGVYRSEINSCMNYGIPYFNAISRQDIMKRILEYSGEGFTMEKFYATDSDKWGSTGQTSRAAMVGEENSYAASGLHHPVRIVKSKKY